MSDISQVFKPGRKALIPYVTIGYPSLDTTLKVVPLLAENGADIIELGIPFSDPLADGTTIQRASFRALENGVTPRLCLELAGKLSKKVNVPLVFMTYYNPIFRHGLERFCSESSSSGISGLIIPDLPPEEGRELEQAGEGHGLDIIYLLAPTSTPERIRLVGERSRGFIYIVSVTGVTGSRQDLPVGLGQFVTQVRELVRQPLCIGFGISTPEQAARVARIADGVIVGSKLIQLMETDSTLEQAGLFVKQLRLALDGESGGLAR